MVINTTNYTILLYFLLFCISACMPGYSGINCTNACPHPTYGDGCQGVCNCNVDMCDVSTGCTQITTGTNMVYRVYE